MRAKQGVKHPSSDFGRIGSGSAWLFSEGQVQSLIASNRSGDPLVFSAALWPISVLGFHNKSANCKT